MHSKSILGTPDFVLPVKKPQQIFESEITLFFIVSKEKPFHLLKQKEKVLGTIVPSNNEGAGDNVQCWST